MFKNREGLQFIRCPDSRPSAEEKERGGENSPSLSGTDGQGKEPQSSALLCWVEWKKDGEDGNLPSPPF